MSQDFGLPQMGFDMTEGKIAQWTRQEGDTVQPGEVLAEIATDKVNLELVDHPGGRIEKILVPAGETVAVGTPIVRFADSGSAPVSGGAAAGAPAAQADSVGRADSTKEATPVEGSTPAAPADGSTPAEQAETASEASEAAGQGTTTRVSGAQTAQPPAPANNASTGDPSKGDRTRVSPLAKKLAEEKGVDLAGLQGSGPGGRILRDDVLQAASAAPRPDGSPAAVPVPGAPTPVTTMPGAAPAGPQELSPIRQAIARRMQESKQQIPHFYLTTSIRMDAALRLREELKHSLGDDLNITINDIVLKAAAVALTRHLPLNAWFMDGKVKMHERVNIGIAVPLEEGLIVPALLDCQNRSLGQISTGARDLVARARKGAVKPEEFTGGTFTTSNLGMFGVDSFQAIINPPQVAILAIGAARKQAVVEGDALVPGTLMNVCLSCDHRVVDGAAGSRFLAEIRQLLENPMLMLV